MKTGKKNTGRGSATDIDNSLRVHLDHGTEPVERRLLLVVVTDVAKRLAPALSEHWEVDSDLIGADKSEPPDGDGSILEKGAGSCLVISQELKEPFQDGWNKWLDLRALIDEVEGLTKQ